jgi:D-glycero-D-manno-heptose 1,7-bisphosphate phosphatase
MMPKSHTRKAVFLDRDGTLIDAIIRPLSTKIITAPVCLNEMNYVHEARHVKDELKAQGYLRIIDTNQPDVALGYLTEDVWEEIHARVIENLLPDDCFMCRHRTKDQCPMKKPSPMMLYAAADKYGIDLSRSFMVGDTHKDTQAGKAAGCTTILLTRFYNRGVKADMRIPDLSSILDIIP